MDVVDDCSHCDAFLTRFRRKRHSRYMGLRELITNAVDLKKNPERHIFKI